MKSRIKEELESLKTEIASYMENKASLRLEYSFWTDIYQGLQPDLIHKLDAKTVQRIIKTYIMIRSLALTVPDRSKAYREAIETINETLKLLE